METWIRTVWDHRDLYLQGLQVTMEICLYGFVAAVCLGLVICILRLYVRPLRWLAVILTEYLRNTPILVQLLWVAYVWPELFGWPQSFFTAGWIALALQSGGYLSETFRAGLQGIGRGQTEASLALGLSPFQNFRRIVLPQAALVVAPSLTNQMIVLVKSSTLVAIISVPDLMHQALRQTNIYYEPVPILTSAALVYVALIYLLSILQKAVADGLRRRYGL